MGELAAPGKGAHGQGHLRRQLPQNASGLIQFYHLDLILGIAFFKVGQKIGKIDGGAAAEDAYPHLF